MIARDARLLAIVVARIGDTMLATPVLRTLRAAAPDGTLDVIAHPKRIAVLAHLPFIDRLIPAGRTRLLVERLRGAARYDVAVVFGNDTPLFEHAFAVASRVVSFRQRDAAISAQLAPAVERPAAIEHAVTERLRLARALGIDARDLRLAYRVLPEERAAAERLVASLFAHRPRPLLTVVPKSFPTKAYRDWPQERFAAVFERLFAERKDAGVLLLGDDASREVADTLVARFPGRVASAAGRLALRQSAAAIAAGDGYLGVDTGPTHIAGALDVPMVALYHCCHRGRHLAPLQRQHLAVVEHPCPDERASETVPMADIGVESVWQGLLQVLPADAACATA
jgi:heptosyltransferase-3